MKTENQNTPSAADLVCLLTSVSPRSRVRIRVRARSESRQDLRQVLSPPPTLGEYR
ncbi:hypothetical protein RSSM_06015 [Rhodopirellula sallentina SM41]|uniref:Uncharacterized protein n=1 Tax=Rhodopirellula sallentina SM41 TaxID=1263870 RepID=M5U3V1_9BACT|nr:hypothetical protein RSSM_06015 [Rhodopirellula sallentina SM41]